MPSLVEQLGTEYIDQFYRGAYFLHEGKVYRYGRHGEERTIHCKVLEQRGDSMTWVNTFIAPDLIQNMDFFGWPKLGYREFAEGTAGDKHVFFVSLGRSAMRGLRDELLQFNPTPIVRNLPRKYDLRSWCRDQVYANAIFNPKFTPFEEGVAALREGQYSSFALNEDIAMCISTTKGIDRTIDVLFKENIVGEVLEDNTVKVPRKILKRSANLKVFNGRALAL